MSKFIQGFREAWNSIVPPMPKHLPTWEGLGKVSAVLCYFGCLATIGMGGAWLLLLLWRH